MKPTKVFNGTYKGMSCKVCHRWSLGICDINKETKANNFSPLFEPHSQERLSKKEIMQMYQDHFEIFVWKPMGLGIDVLNTLSPCDHEKKVELRKLAHVEHSWQNMKCQKCHHRNRSQKKCEIFGFTDDWRYCVLFMPSRFNSIETILRNWTDHFQRWYLEPHHLL